MANAGARRRVADQRREQTVALLDDRGVMSPAELAAHFGVSVMTVHRDLNELQRRGIIRKSHGGVTAQPPAMFEATMAFREGHMVPAKAAIAAAAVDAVTSGSSVLLDDSTTVAHLVPLLPSVGAVTVATNGLSTLRPLASDDQVNLIALGGQYDPIADAFVGTICLRDITALRVDAVFLSAAGVTAAGAYHADPTLVAVKQAMMAVAARRYLLVDHTKIDKPALHEFAALSEFDEVIVDPDTPADAAAALRASGAKVRVA